MNQMVTPLTYQHKQSSFLQQPQSQQFTCLDIIQHINKCPICSRLHDTDKTLYIMAIFLMGVVIVILLIRKNNRF